jgi:hypothetical protein
MITAWESRQSDLRGAGYEQGNASRERERLTVEQQPDRFRRHHFDLVAR